MKAEPHLADAAEEDAAAAAVVAADAEDAAVIEACQATGSSRKSAHFAPRKQLHSRIWTPDKVLFLLNAMLLNITRFAMLNLTKRIRRN